MLIFKTKILPIKSLNENIEKISNPLYLSSFPTLSDLRGKDKRKIEIKNNHIHFPDYGNYYIRTNFGSFKILLLNPESNEDEQVLKICEFISINSICLSYDEKYFHDFESEFCFEKVSKILFYSEFPIKMECGSLSVFCFYFLKRFKIYSKVIHLNDHCVLDVFLPIEKKFVFWDLTFSFTAYNCKKSNIKNMISTEDVVNRNKNKNKIYYKNYNYNRFAKTLNQKLYNNFGFFYLRKKNIPNWGIFGLFSEIFFTRHYIKKMKEFTKTYNIDLDYT